LAQTAGTQFGLVQFDTFKLGKVKNQELLINDKNASATNTMRKTCPNKMYVLVR
jgi:hypothetical protein